MKLTKKLIVIVIITMIIFHLTIPIIMAVSEEFTTLNSNEENNEIITEDESYIKETANIVNNNISQTITNDFLDNNSTNEILENNILNTNTIEDNNISKDEINSNNMLSMFDSYGIYIQKDYAEFILNILNFNSIYTYSIDKNQKLQCNGIKKVNEYLDTNEETEVDIVLKQINKNLNKKIIITLDDNSSNNLTATNVYEDNNCKYVLLNTTYFTKELMNEYHPSLSDYILKGLLYEETATIMSSFATTGRSTSSQVVYFGPSTANYAEIGSINWHEQVQIIGMTNDWYHITYEIGTSGTYKTGYVPKNKIYNASGPDLYEEVLIGGYRFANQQTYIWSYDVSSQSVNIGTVFNNEGVTCLYDYTNSAGVNVSYIEFSTSLGTKRGYVETSKLTNQIDYYENGHHYDTTVGYVKYDVNLTMGVGSGYNNTGIALSKDEYVAVLGKENNNLYVEYNTKSGRKRAFTTTDYIELTRHYTNGVLNWYSDLPVLYGQKISTVSQTVRGTPSIESASIGSIDLGEAVYVYMNHRFNDINNTYSYIAYNTTNGKKTGYVPTSTLSNFQSVSLPEFKNFEGATKTIMQSAGDVNGSNTADMAFYSVGTGNNKLYLVFNQHGWEDGYPGDGVERTRISQQFLTTLTDSTNSDILEDWTVYVVCDANPNGILNGEEHDGIGRTVPYSGVDMNRAWPTINWTPNISVPRGKKNYTGTNPTQDCLELKHVKDWLEDNAPDSNYKSVLIDIHGWDCEIFGDTTVGAYYNTADTFNTDLSGKPFYSVLYNHKFQNDNRSGGNGYLIKWAKEVFGVKNTALLELPYPGDAVMQSNGVVNITNIATADDNNVTEYDYAGRFITGTLNLLNNF